MTVYGDSDAWIKLFYGTDTIVGDTNTNTTINDLSSAEVAKCSVGMPITGTDIPAGTLITAVGTTSITISQAATGTTNDVTFTLPNALCIRAEDWEYDNSDPMPIAVDYPNRGHFGKTLDSEKVQIKIKNAYVTTEADWNILKTQLQAAKTASDTVLKIQVSSTPSFELFDGVAGNDEMPVLVIDRKGHSKKYRGDTTFYILGQIMLRQSGSLQ